MDDAVKKELNKLYDNVALCSKFFRIRSITPVGSRDKRGRFVKSKAVVQKCDKSDAEYMTGIIMMKSSFMQKKQERGETDE